MMKIMLKRSHGFTLLEILIALAILMIFFGAVITMVQIGLKALGEARLRSMAIRLASERLELARTVTYEQLGTVGGIPSGSLPATETETVDNTPFTIKTAVVYIDDPFDGVAPSDTIPTDYKQVRVEVSWGGLFASKQPALLLTDIAPRGLESVSGGGTLQIIVYNGQGQGVSNATVHIEAAEVNPPISMDALTDIDGKIMLPGAPICVSCYQISVTKSGFTSDRTYGTSEVANPTNPHVSVIESQVSEASLSIDQTATLNLRVTRSAASNYSTFAGVQLTLTGTKIIGKTAADEPVYLTQRNVVSGAGGLATVSNLVWDSYNLTIPTGSSVDFAGSYPFTPLTVNPGSTISVGVVVEPATPHSLLVQLTNSTNLPVDAATVEISKSGIVATKSAGLVTQGDQSQVFFPNLSYDFYTIKITADGYEQVDSTVSVFEDKREFFILAEPSAP